jgi:RND family efflux transporter MFP subunit
MRALDYPKVIVIGAGWGVVTLLNMVILPARYSAHVTAEIVQSAPLALIVRAPGNLDARASVTLKGQFDGPLVNKLFREGQNVKAGQLLAVINRDKVLLEYQEKQDALANAKADLQQARKEIRLQKTLYDKEAVAYSAVEEAQRNLVKATQALRGAEEAYRIEQARWNSANVVAPIAGTVVKDGVGEDKFVTSGKEIVTVADVSEFTVKARVDELDIKRLTENQSAEVRIQIFPQHVFKARVTQIGSQADAPDSTAIPVVLTLEGNQGVLLRPRLTADVRIITGQTQPALSVPLSAINNADGNTRVWILGLWNRLAGRTVTLGQTNPDRVEVTQGLRPGERICATAEPNLAEGMRVYVGATQGASARRSFLGACRVLWAKIMKGRL